MYTFICNTPSDVIEIMWGECPFCRNVVSSTINSFRKLCLLHLISDWIHMPRAGQIPDLHMREKKSVSMTVRGARETYIIRSFGQGIYRKHVVYTGCGERENME